ncbi:PREDICTED: facilitated trehalose transporter Tret1-like [Ceratosolen solmsi marchali]|uniref:Facilitated trehalose transporter Tret1-like n=1 Tax=Ceratosolen solmsi marchali TaxID=326594 RepID=A0AAJ6YSV7_9HYME|nr:PREDICTED: facilitated trehalose transporter Tret1-like [Ceratosolen solmsi marchali]
MRLGGQDERKRREDLSTHAMFLIGTGFSLSTDIWIIIAEIGVMCGWSSPDLVLLTTPESPLPLTLIEGSWVASLLYLILIILLIFLPDSPHYLVQFGNIEEARKSLKWYRNDEKVEKELEEIIKFVKSTATTSFLETLTDFRLKHVRKATILVMMLFIFMQLSGLNNVLFYMEIILVRSKSKLINTSSAVAYILACSITTWIACLRLYNRCGRRILLIWSSIGVTVALTALESHFMMMETKIEWAGSEWLPIISLFAFIIFFVLGLASIPSIVASEVYAVNVKSVATCIANLTAASAAFLSSKCFQLFVDLFGEAYVFYGHAIITFMAVP